MKMKFGISALLVSLMLMSIAIVPALGLGTDQSLTSEKDIDYTDAELQSLYVKYNVTENDIKLVKGELPNFLEGTVLCGEQRVVVTEDGKPVEGMKEGIDYDIIMSEPEMFEIIDKAEAEFMEKWGVDPSNPKVDIINGKAIPVEEVKILVKEGLTVSSDSPVVSTINEGISNVKSVSSNPKAVNSKIYLHIYPAKDSAHSPGSSSNYYDDTIDASERFEGFGITVNRVWHYNFWDASDVSSPDDSSQVLADLNQDCAYIRDSSNDIVLGWVDYMTNNGIAYKNGAYSVCALSAAGLDWPHDSIVQHEISHNFGADDQNSATHPTCIMNYAYAYAGTNVWCTSCSSTVNYGIFH